MRLVSAVFVCSSLVLTACGGGSDGGGGTTPQQPSAPQATITPTNAPQIAAATLDASFEPGGLSDFAAISLPSAAVASSSGAIVALGEIQRQNAEILLDSGAPNAVIVQDETVQCTLGGTVRVVVDLTNTETITPGDSVNADYTECSETEGVVIDGTFDMTISEFSGDLVSGQVLLSVQVVLGNFMIVEGTETATISGDMTMSIDTRTVPVATISISASSLTVASGGTTHTLSDYLAVQTLDESATSFSMEVSGTLTSSEFDGAVDFETTAALETFGDTFAFTGEILITGAQNATIRIVVVNESSIELEVDSDGDGTVDETIQTTWAELMSAA